MHTLPTNNLLNWRVHELHQILNLRQNRACCLWHTLSLREGFLLDNCERWRSRRCFSMGRKSPPLCSSALQTPEIETIINIEISQSHNLVATFRIITFFVKQVAFIQFCTAFKILSEWRKKTYFSIDLVDIFECKFLSIFVEKIRGRWVAKKMNLCSSTILAFRLLGIFLFKAQSS